MSAVGRVPGFQTVMQCRDATVEEHPDSRLILKMQNCVNKIKNDLPDLDKKGRDLAGKVIELCQEHENNLSSFQQEIQDLPWPGSPKQRLPLLLLREAHTGDKHPKRSALFEQYRSIPWSLADGNRLTAYAYLVETLIALKDYSELSRVHAYGLSEVNKDEASKETRKRRLMNQIRKFHGKQELSLNNGDDWIQNREYSLDRWMIATAMFQAHHELAKDWLESCARNSSSENIVHWSIGQAIESDESKLADEICTQNGQHPNFSEKAFLKKGLKIALNSGSFRDKNGIIKFYRQKLEQSLWMKQAPFQASAWIVEQLTENNDSTGDRANHLIEFLQRSEQRLSQKIWGSLLMVTVRAILSTKDHIETFQLLVLTFLENVSGTKKYFPSIACAVATADNEDHSLFYLKNYKNVMGNNTRLLQEVVLCAIKFDKRIFVKRLFDEYKQDPYPEINLRNAFDHETRSYPYAVAFMGFICRYKKDWIEFLNGNEDETFGLENTFLVLATQQAVANGAIKFVIEALKKYAKTCVSLKGSNVSCTYPRFIVQYCLKKKANVFPQILKGNENLQDARKNSLLQIVTEEARALGKEDLEDLLEGFTEKGLQGFAHTLCQSGLEVKNLLQRLVGLGSTERAKTLLQTYEKNLSLLSLITKDGGEAIAQQRELIASVIPLAKKNCNEELDNRCTEQYRSCSQRIPAGKRYDRESLLNWLKNHRNKNPITIVHEMITLYMQSANEEFFSSRDVVAYQEDIQKLRESLFNLSGKKDEFLHPKNLYFGMSDWARKRLYSFDDRARLYYIVARLQSIQLSFLSLHSIFYKIGDKVSLVGLETFLQNEIIRCSPENLKSVRNLPDNQQTWYESYLLKPKTHVSYENCPVIATFHENVVRYQLYLAGENQQGTLDWIGAQNVTESNDKLTPSNTEVEEKQSLGDRRGKRKDLGDQKEIPNTKRKRIEKKSISGKTSSSGSGS